MLEADVKRKAMLQLKANGCYTTRIEDKYRVGFPDVLAILPDGPTVFAEFKVFSGLAFGPTPRQLVELQRIGRVSRNAIACVVGWRRGLYHVHRPADVCKAADCPSHADFYEALKLYLNTGADYVTDCY